MLAGMGNGANGMMAWVAVLRGKSAMLARAQEAEGAKFLLFHASKAKRERRRTRPSPLFSTVALILSTLPTNVPKAKREREGEGGSSSTGLGTHRHTPDDMGQDTDTDISLSTSPSQRCRHGR